MLTPILLLVMYAHHFILLPVSVTLPADIISIEFNNVTENDCDVYPLAPLEFQRSVFHCDSHKNIQMVLHKCPICFEGK